MQCNVMAIELPFGFDADSLVAFVEGLAVFEPGDGRHRVAPGAATQDEPLLLLHGHALLQSRRHWKPCCTTPRNIYTKHSIIIAAPSNDVSHLQATYIYST